MHKLSHQTRSFDGFTLDLTRGCLLRGTQEVKLPPKPFEALKHLVENSGRLISKAEFIQVLWPDTAVTDDSLVQCLMEVRRALGDEAQLIIKTVPRRGYIFDRAVQAVPAFVTTYTDETGVRVIIEEQESNGQDVNELVVTPVSNALTQIPARKPGSFEQLTTAIKGHAYAVMIAILSTTIAVFAIAYFTRPGEAIDSIAVMPFVNVSGDPNAEYLSDGLTESLIDRLSKLPSLKTVIARNSVMRYRGKQTDPQAVAHDLNVRAVLFGQLTQRGDDISISIELVDARYNKHLWGGHYNRKLADINVMQTEIAQDISENLRLRLSGDDRQRLTRAYTQSGEAYQLYMMGRYYGRKRTKGGWEKSIDYYNQAVAKDPNYALAYTGLASSYASLGFTGLMDPKEAHQKEEWAVLKAMQIDDSLAEAHIAMSHLRTLDLNWQGAEEERQRALELNPNSVEVLSSGNSYLSAFGRFDEAMQHLERAQELDPLSSAIYSDKGLLLYFARQPDRAIEQLKKALELDPNSVPAHARLTWVYLEKHMYDEAIAEQKKAIALEDASGNWRRTSLLGFTYGVAGKKEEALKILTDLQSLSKERYVAPYNFALIYIGLGDKEQAFTWLNKAYEERSDSLRFLKVNPIYDSLRSDPRFADLLKRMKLT